MVLDPEDYFSEQEIKKVRSDIEQRGLSLILLADWYNKDLMSKN